MNIGDFVRYKGPPGIESDSYGRVQAIETYRDANGLRTWFYVRWVGGGGMPQDRDITHHISELELIEDHQETKA